MAIIRNSTPFDSVKKKFSGTDEIYFKNRAADNATIGVRMKHPYSGCSTKQEAVRAALATASAAAKAALADPEQRKTYQEAFDKQKKYLYLRQYVTAQLYVAPTF